MPRGSPRGLGGNAQTGRRGGYGCERGKGQAASLVEGLGSETRRRVRWATAEALIEHELRGARSVVRRLGQGQGIAYQMTEEAANACLTSATCDL